MTAAKGDRLHPRLRISAQRIGKLLGITDPVELNAALDDIQTLLFRCGYHLQGQRADKMWRRRKAGARRRAGHAVAPNQPRGRPLGSAQLAARQLGLGLAFLWLDLTGCEPRRRFSWATQREYGPYREFVQLVVDLVPRLLRVRRKGSIPSVDFLVRDGIQELRAARCAPEEYRRRGVIDERRWLRVAND